MTRHTHTPGTRVRPQRASLGVAVALAALLALWARSASAFLAPQDPIRVDCGSVEGSTDADGIMWLPDQYFANGTAKSIQPTYYAGGLLKPVDRTLRYWEVGDSCYRVPVTPGRYLVRLSFSYNNFDNNYYNLLPLNLDPSVGVSINDYFVEVVGIKGLNTTAYYTDYIVFSQPAATTGDGANNGHGNASQQQHEISVCFLPFQGNPFVNSLQVLPMDTDAYFASTTGANVVLSNWVRINAGGAAIGPEPSGSDPGHRTWDADVGTSKSDPWVQMVAATSAAAVTVPASWESFSLPSDLFTTARVAGGKSKTTGYNFTGLFPVDQDNEFMVLLYFAEIEAGVGVGERVMDVWVNGKWTTIDIAERAGGANTALVYSLNRVKLGGVPNSPDGQWLAVLLRPAGGDLRLRAPMISGVEVYEVIYGGDGGATTGGSDGAGAGVGGGDTQIRIDCGGQYNYTDSMGFAWSADYGYSSGAPAIVVEPGNDFEFSKSLRYFPSARINCYDVPVPKGRYLFRMFFNYGNYDQLSETPTFGFGVEGAPMVALQPDAPGGFQEAVAFVEDGEASVCLFGHREGGANSNGVMLPSVINSIEILQVNNNAYESARYGRDLVLYDYYRVNAGGQAFGEGLTAGKELGHRQWGDETTSGVTLRCNPACDNEFLPQNVASVKGVDAQPDAIPLELVKTARTARTRAGAAAGAVAAKAGDADGSVVAYNLTGFMPGEGLAIFLRFAELRSGVKAGERVFSVYLNGEAVPAGKGIDLAGKVGPFALFSLNLPYQLAPEGSWVSLELRADKGSALAPIVSGVEVYGLMERGPAVSADTLAAMAEVKRALQVPESLSWQGDPCFPLAWTGVNCTVDGMGVAQIEIISLPNVALNGSIPPAISQLTSLVSLNLSRNALTGPIPAAITAFPHLASLDLSFNQLNGSIPAGMASMPSLHLLYLNDNDLAGVPQGLVPAPSGLTLSLANNPYLCGTDGLQSCDSAAAAAPPGTFTAIPLPPPSPSTSSGSSGMSTGVVVGIVIAALCGMALLVSGGVFVWRRQQRRQMVFSDSELMHQNMFPYSKSNTRGFEEDSVSAGSGSPYVHVL
ncbi:hypothetical protein CLOP_g2316 [Closterium sp. NIES-67]|nr:hypothetical protein CLOP_g2316 [Closterium sp. NIES-67]